MTADATPEARQECIDSGVDAFLTKPINSRALLEQVSLLAQQIPVKQKDKTKAHSENVQASSQLFDSNKLAELINLDQDKQFILSLIESFKHDASKHVGIICAASKDDYLTYRESLHALKGSATEMGAVTLSTLCTQGEQLKPDDIGSDQLLTLCKQLEKTFHETISALEIEVLGSQSNEFLV